MQQFSAYYRRTYGASLGIGESGCPPAGSVFVWADVDQRTRATGDAVLAGLAPGSTFRFATRPPIRINSSIRCRVSAWSTRRSRWHPFSAPWEAISTR